MPFFARPDLSNEQFKQLQGSELTLSGQTQIATASGFTLTDGAGGYVPIIATGATGTSKNGHVLTYDSIKNQILLKAVSGGSGLYNCASPTTCTVGGLPSGSAIFGRSIEEILEDILVPTAYPTLTPPSSTFSIAPNNVMYEVGTSVNIVGTSCFNQGCILPQYTSTSNKRSGNPVRYIYNTYGTMVCVNSTALSHVFHFSTYQIQKGNNTLSSSVGYSAGVQPMDSAGNNYCAPLPSGSTNFSSVNISGIYPYFYGKVASGGAPAGSCRPTASAGFVTGGTKVVALSDNTICIDFSSGSDDYIWFAVPQMKQSVSESCNLKTRWYVDALNNGTIGGVVSAGGNLFPSPSSTPNVTTVLWCQQTYDVYISNYQTTSSIIQIRNN